MKKEINLYDGKYTFKEQEDGSLICLRYGEKWRDFIGDNAVHALFNYCCQAIIKED